MPTLTVTDFSCLKEAVLDLSRVNVVIGPQGTGKSVTTKLMYFFVDIMSGFIQYAERQESLEDYKKIVAKQFALWFPPSAWGSGRFNIQYSASLFNARILRRHRLKKLSDEVSVKFSVWFNELYETAVDLFANQQAGLEFDLNDNGRVNDAFDRVYRVRDFLIRKMQQELSDEFIGRQTFIPAGRAFFTGMGKFFAAFDQVGSLDPVTLKFARLFSSIREQQVRRYSHRRLGSDFLAKRNSFMNELFGGEIRSENDLDFVEMPDGRRVPFSSLSSGQQELLPMWSIMDYFNELDAMRSSSSQRTLSRPRELIYIEEPEAHLFPSAQSLLMQFLVGSVLSERRRILVITTHSPYIMSQLNVFLKAGQIARRKKRNIDVNEIVPRECWLNETQLSAFSISDGRLNDIMDDDGLIDGRYLDSISESLAQKFSDLLQIESEI